MKGRGLSAAFNVSAPYICPASGHVTSYATPSCLCCRSAPHFHRTMAGETDRRVAVAFDEVAILFSGDEWDLLSDQQRALYMEVMKENYEHFIFLGLKVPIILSWLQNRNPAPVVPRTSSPLELSNQKDVAAPHTKSNNKAGGQTNSYSHPGNGAIKKRQSKRLEERNGGSPRQDENRNSPAAPSRNLRERRQFYCSHCGKCFKYSSALEAHLRVHSGDKPHQCSDCHRSFSYKSALIVHRRKHSTSSTNGLKNEAPSKAEALPSASTAPRPGEPTLQTSTSNSAATPDLPTSTSNSAPSTSRKPLPQIESEKPLKCNYCEKRFNDASILEAHHRIHTGKLAFPCAMCDKSFSKPSLLAAHNNTHKEGKPFQCDQCDKNFNDQSLLVAHKRTHTGEKPHKCSHCCKWFPNYETLAEHEEGHLRPKPYKCRHCDKSFNDKSLLITHEGVHTDTKPFKCTQCSESFFLKTQLMAHQATHAPDKPFPCNQCERSFNKRETLIAHIRVHNLQSVQVKKKA